MSLIIMRMILQLNKT